MKRIVVCLAALFACQAAAAQDETGVAQDAEAIRQSAESYVAAYNQRDAQGLANLWSPEAVYIHRDTGQRIQGRDAIAAMFGELFQNNENSQLSVTIDAIRLITPEVAIEDGTAHLAPPGGEALDSTYTAVHVKREGVWLLDSVRETDTPAPAVSAPSELDQLAWMVGEWLDQDENSAIHTRCEWAKNKSFLTSSFTVSVQDKVELEGTQVIGWDPVAGKIRSWMFDSQGGFGEGSWRQNGNQWIVDSTMTLADGTQGSAVNVFTLVDDNTFTWQSNNRDINGEPQADIAAVHVHRQ